MLNPDLRDVARQAMIDEGFEPDFGADVRAELEHPPATADVGPPPRDLRDLQWSSIDNDDTRDLDQVEFAEPIAGGTRLLIGVADVDRRVMKDSAIDKHAAAQATTVYTGVEIFPMLPTGAFRWRDLTVRESGSLRDGGGDRHRRRRHREIRRRLSRNRPQQGAARISKRRRLARAARTGPAESCGSSRPRRTDSTTIRNRCRIAEDAR